jgi:hypothetical protein
MLSLFKIQENYSKQQKEGNNIHTYIHILLSQT